MHGLGLELKIVGLPVGFRCRGHVLFSFSGSPPLVHSFGGTSICRRIFTVRYSFHRIVGKVRIDPSSFRKNFAGSARMFSTFTKRLAESPPGFAEFSPRLAESPCALAIFPHNVTEFRCGLAIFPRNLTGFPRGFATFPGDLPTLPRMLAGREEKLKVEN